MAHQEQYRRSCRGDGDSVAGPEQLVLLTNVPSPLHFVEQQTQKPDSINE